MESVREEQSLTLALWHLNTCSLQWPCFRPSRLGNPRTPVSPWATQTDSRCGALCDLSPPVLQLPEGEISCET